MGFYPLPYVADIALDVFLLIFTLLRIFLFPLVPIRSILLSDRYLVALSFDIDAGAGAATATIATYTTTSTAAIASTLSTAASV